MKFLCVKCDEPMKLLQTRSSESQAGGSLSVLFGCPTCRHQVCMLTNPWETQVVTSLGVQIGPQPTAPGERASPSQCPFGEMVREMQSPGKEEDAPGWTAAAFARLQNIPEFVRPMAKQGIEHFARSRGYVTIDEKVLEEAREQFGM